MAKRFHIRTFGCQMNEHDSERLAGMLRADGLEATDDPEVADVIVLNTCCIRENADNKLYGHLGHLKALKDAGPTSRSPSGAASPRRTAATSCAGPGTSTSSSAPTTSPTHPCCSTGPARTARSSRSSRRTPRAPRGHPGPGRQRAPRLGDDPDRLRQQLHVLHRPDRAGTRDQPAARRRDPRDRGPRGRRRPRGHAPRPERQLVRP